MLAGLDGGSFDAVVPLARILGLDHQVRAAELTSCTLETSLDLTCGDPVVTSSNVQFNVFGPPVGVMAGFNYTFAPDALVTAGTHDTTGVLDGRVTVIILPDDPTSSAAESSAWALAIAGFTATGAALRRVRSRFRPAC